MDKPTEAQIKEFWEWCGFKSRLVWSDPADIVPRHQFTVWDYPDGSGVTQNLSVNPPIDLNNLFKYAVPKLHRKEGNVAIVSHITEEEGWHYSAKIGAGRISVEDKDPALALFWAICQVM